MCGVHHFDDGGERLDGHHHHIRHGSSVRSRRAFLGDVGGGALALALLTPAALAACSADNAGSDGSTDEAGGTGSESETTAADNTASDNSASSDTDSNDTASADDGDSDAGDSPDSGVRWARANLGFVSAYVLVRGDRAAIVDTGSAGSADAIGQTLQDLGLNYSDVERVILTHKHPDHVGSIAEVLAQAVNAAAYAGEADLGAIDGDISPLVGGEDVFGLEILATPGHTPGHMAVIDHDAGLLVAGDALATEGGAAAEVPQRFTEDLDLSHQSIRALAELTFNTLLVGHGDPLESGADASVAELAAALG